MIGGNAALALIVAGRIAIGAMFLTSAIANATRNLAGLETAIAAKDLPQPWLLVRLAVAVEGVGALLLILSLWPAVGAALLAGFTIVATYFFHAFWQYAGEERRTQVSNALTNAAIVGGLLLAIATA